MFRVLILAAMLWLQAGSAWAVDLVIWHDKGDDGIKMFNQIAAAYRKTHADVNITSLSRPIRAPD